MQTIQAPVTSNNISNKASGQLETSGLTSGRRLPYAQDQRVEFLHIQAETEVLLQQLYLEQQRRQAEQIH